MKHRKSVSAEQFIRYWQVSATLEEAAARCGTPVRHATSRAVRYRRLGIQLKKFARGRRRWDAAKLAQLAAIAKQCAPKGTT